MDSSDPFTSTLVLVHEDGSGTRRLGVVRIPPEGPLPVPAFSPDGAWLAWYGVGFARHRLSSRLMVTDTRTGSVVTPTCEACGPESLGGGGIWSPDGGSLAWAQDGHVVVGANGRVVRRDRGRRLTGVVVAGRVN